MIDPFNRRLADEVRPDLLHYAAVEDAAGQVFGARLRSPLDDENLVPRPCQLIGGNAAGDPGPYDDHVEIDAGVASGALPSWVSGRTEPGGGVGPSTPFRPRQARTPSLICSARSSAASQPDVKEKPLAEPGIGRL